MATDSSAEEINLNIIVKSTLVRDNEQLLPRDNGDATS